MSCPSWPCLDDCNCPCEACKKRRLSGLTSCDSDQDITCCPQTSVAQEEKAFPFKRCKEFDGRDLVEEEAKESQGNGRFRDSLEMVRNVTKGTYQRDFKSEEKKTCTRTEGNEEINGLSSSVFWTFLKESIGVLAYFSFLTLCLWATLMSYGLKLGMKFYNSKNRLQILAYIFVGLLVLLIIGGYLNYKVNKKVAKEPTKPAEKSTSMYMRLWKFFSKEKQISEREREVKSASPSKNWKFWSNGKSPEKTTVTKTTTTTKTNIIVRNEKQDEKKAQEIMQQLKLYAISLDMKRPPQVIISLRDYFLG